MAARLEAGGVGHFERAQRGADAAVGHRVDLNNLDRALLDIAAELVGRVQTLADCDRHGELAREPRMARDVLGNRWLLVPVEAERLQAPAALERLPGAPGHVRVDHQVDALADELAHRGYARFVLLGIGLADLYLHTGKAAGEKAFGL